MLGLNTPLHWRTSLIYSWPLLLASVINLNNAGIAWIDTDANDLATSLFEEQFGLGMRRIFGNQIYSAEYCKKSHIWYSVEWVKNKAEYIYIKY